MIATVCAIPRGRVSSYGEIARRAGFPGYARHVGRVLGTLPAASQVPWQRVLRSDGHLAFAPGTTAHLRQRQALEAEGVPLRNGRVPRNYFVD